MAEQYARLYVNNTQLFSSTLLTFGLADFADKLLDQQAGEDREVRIEHCPTYNIIHLDPAIDLSFSHKFVPLLRLIATEKNKNTLPVDVPAPWVYDNYKQQVAEYFELRKSLTPAQRSSKASPDEFPILHELARLQPNTAWYGMVMINQMQALTGYNDAATAWLACKSCWSELLSLIMHFWGSTSNDSDAALAHWQKLLKTYSIQGKEFITASQTVNPEQGKGANRPKADALTVGNQSSFWLEEAMKFAGVFVGAVPRTVSGSKDRKTYVLVPKVIKLSTHRDVYERFQQSLWPTSAVKMDILAALQYSLLFVQQFQEGQNNTSPQPNNYIQGLATTSYKDLGSAVATMNISTINLPNWVASLKGKQDARQLETLFEEHITLIQVLDEGKGSEEALLHNYRDFLSSRDPQLTAFFHFTTAYAAHIMGKLVRRQFAPRITTASLEVIIVTNDQQRTNKLTPIISNPGFQNIAEAIRRSTVIPQYQKNEGTRTYDIRYGLGDQLKRKARYPLQFMEALSDFVHLYNQENARVAEKQKMQFRKAITTEDLAQVAQLLDEYGDDASTVAYLLIAYGYARDKDREPKVIGQQSGSNLSNPEVSQTLPEANVEDDPNLPY